MSDNTSVHRDTFNTPMAVVQRRPGTKQGLVSRLFDGESAKAPDVHTKPAKPAQVRADVHRKAGKVNKPAANVKRGGRK